MKIMLTRFKKKLERRLLNLLCFDIGRVEHVGYDLGG